MSTPSEPGTIWASRVHMERQATLADRGVRECRVCTEKFYMVDLNREHTVQDCLERLRDQIQALQAWRDRPRMEHS